jgi:hypothetical protein
MFIAVQYVSSNKMKVIYVRVTWYEASCTFLRQPMISNYVIYICCGLWLCIISSSSQNAMRLVAHESTTKAAWACILRLVPYL